MSQLRAFSSPDLAPPSSTSRQYERADDHSLEGIAANVKLLLKLIQDHSEVNTRENEERKVLRVAGMMSIIDDVKTRIQKSQSSAQKKELRRCSTDLRPNVPRDIKRPTQQEPLTTDEKQKLRKELSASLAARKSLEIMCSSLGKEKEIMASELARKVQELNGMEELINDLKAQNEMLLEKLQTWKAKAKAAAEAAHKEKKGSEISINTTTTTTPPPQGNAALQDRNKALSEQLLKSLDGYRSLKRKFKEAKEENMGIRAAMEEMEMEVHGGLDRICSFRQRIASRNNEDVNIQEEVSALEQMFECFNMKISKHQQKKSEGVKPKREINAGKASVLQERKG